MCESAHFIIHNHAPSFANDLEILEVDFVASILFRIKILKFG